jgi:hypothetical protein
MSTPEQRRTLPYLAVSTHRAATAMTAPTGWAKVFAMTEPSACSAWAALGPNRA